VNVWLYNALADCPSPHQGDIVYTEADDAYQYWNGTTWKPLGGGGGAGPWTPLDMGDGWAADFSSSTPAYRMEGDLVRFKGGLDGSSAVSGAPAATYPISAFPPGSVRSSGINLLSIMTDYSTGVYVPVYVQVMTSVVNSVSVAALYCNNTTDGSPIAPPAAGMVFLDNLAYTVT
jgi:hypothetical protein